MNFVIIKAHPILYFPPTLKSATFPMSSCFPGQVNLISKVEAVKSIDPKVRSDTAGCVMDRKHRIDGTFGWGVQVIQVESTCGKNFYETTSLQRATISVIYEQHVSQSLPDLGSYKGSGKNK